MPLRNHMDAGSLFNVLIGNGTKIMSLSKEISGTVEVHQDWPPVLYLNPGLVTQIVRLPPATNSEHQFFFIRNTSSDDFVALAIQDQAGESVVSIQNGGAIVHCDGTNWYVIART